FRELYDREPIAARVVQIMPKESWQTQPLVYELEETDSATPFEEAWDSLGKNLIDGSSWFRQEEGSIIWEYLQRADILSGIGHFGVLLLGVDDGKNLQEPIDGAIDWPSSTMSYGGQPVPGGVGQYGSAKSVELFGQASETLK